MPASTIYVNQNGRPASGVKVMLSFATGGITDTVRTNAQGQATISHQGSGTAMIFIDGSKRGTFRAPGTIAVER